MSSTSTSVPAPSFTAAGFVAPYESEILAGRLADINAAFGGALNVTTLSTPQAQLATADAAVIGDANALFLALASGVDPAFATGRMQDAIGRLYFLDRFPATSTLVSATCTGAVGTVIPALAILQASDGSRYTAVEGGAIPASGSLLLAFSGVSTGPTPCPAQTFSIYRTIPGWDSAISTAAGTPGRAVETATAFETRRAASVAINARDSIAAIRGTILALSGVLDAYVIDNPRGASATLGGVDVDAHALYVSVLGGDSSAIAAAILSKKSLGCSYASSVNTSESVIDTTALTTPQPTYTVGYQAAIQTEVNITITIASGVTVPSTVQKLVSAAVTGAFGGSDGGARARIGDTIYASRFYACVAALGPWARVISIQLGAGTDPGSAFSLSLPISQAPVIGTITIVFG